MMSTASRYAAVRFTGIWSIRSGRGRRPANRSGTRVERFICIDDTAAAPAGKPLHGYPEGAFPVVLHGRSQTLFYGYRIPRPARRRPGRPQARQRSRYRLPRSRPGRSWTASGECGEASSHRHLSFRYMRQPVTGSGLIPGILPLHPAFFRILKIKLLQEITTIGHFRQAGVRFSPVFRCAPGLHNPLGTTERPDKWLVQTMPRTGGG